MRKVTYQNVQRVSLRQVCDGHIKFEPEITSRPVDVYKAVLPFYQGADREMMSALCLDSQHRPTCFHICSVGSLNMTKTRAAEIFKIALLSNALALILIHNHPSGQLEPSADDIAYTEAIGKAGKLLGVELYDHLIVTDDRFVSFRERGLIS